jgi:uncharacterized protein YxeA
MKNTQKGFIIPAIIIVMVVLLAGGSFYYVNKKSESKFDLIIKEDVVKEDIVATTTLQSDVATTSLMTKSYSNSKYRFQFKYPENLKLSVYPGSQECEKSTNSTNTGPKVAGIASLNIASILVICTGLTSEIGNKNLDPSLYEKHENLTKVVIAGKDSFKHVFTTATGYSWVVYQIPLDSTHYVEISESNGNADRMRGDMPLTTEQWNVILSSFMVL